MAASPAGGDPGHRALSYHSDEEFLGATVPFLRAGVAAGVPTMAVLPPDNRERAAESLAADATAVEWTDPADWYGHPARTLSRAREFVGDGRARVLGEPTWQRAVRRGAHRVRPPRGAAEPRAAAHTDAVRL